MINVVALITAKPGKRAELLAAFNENRATVLARPGCKAYQANVDASAFPPSAGSLGEDRFAVIEQWEDAAALKAHGKSDYMAAYREKTKDLVADRVVHILEAV